MSLRSSDLSVMEYHHLYDDDDGWLFFGVWKSERLYDTQFLCFAFLSRYDNGSGRLEA